MQKKQVDFRLPALVLMGPPHSGKSVLAYWLTSVLRAQGVAHFLLRTAPDGEGNWFFESRPDAALAMRAQYKTRYTAAMVERLLFVLQHRPLPLIVDIGGRPQGRQKAVIEACTHGILLYRSAATLEFWRDLLNGLSARPTLIALLESRPTGEDVLETPASSQRPQAPLRGTITGLERHHVRAGVVAQALLRRVRALFSFDEEALADYHYRRAPYPVVSEWDLGQRLGKQEPTPWWVPQDLPAVLAHVPPGPVAFYGRGPLWLSAAVLANPPTRLAALFDGHFGWLQPPPVEPSRARQGWRLQRVQGVQALWMMAWPEEGFLWPDPLPWPYERQFSSGVVLSGRMPRWAAVAWTRFLAPRAAWVGLHDPRLAAAVVVASRQAALPVGTKVPEPPGFAVRFGSRGAA